MTPFQEVYDAFFIKEPDENFLYKQDKVFQYLKTGIAYSYKTVNSTLDYKLYLDNSILIIHNKANIDGNIKIIINKNEYIINVLATDTLQDIAEKIKFSIDIDWNVCLDINNSFPIIKVTGECGCLDNIINTNFHDVSNTGIETMVTRTFDGEFINTLGQDEIELISLFMKKEHLRRKINPYIALKQYLGTKDFNKLPEKSSQYKIISQSIKDLDEEIRSFRQEFYTYKN